MDKYEILCVLKPSSHDEIESVITSIEKAALDNDCILHSISRWGRRQLGAAVGEITIGFYVLFTLSAIPNAISELERVMRINHNIFRHAVINKCKKDD